MRISKLISKLCSKKKKSPSVGQSVSRQWAEGEWTGVIVGRLVVDNELLFVIRLANPNIEVLSDLRKNWTSN